MIEPWIIDISRYQITEDGVLLGRTLNWQKAWDAGIRVVAIRCTVGNWYTDPLFYAHWDGAKAQGMITTAYHVTKPSHTYESQMERFFKVLGDRKSDIPLVIDNELTDNMTIYTTTAVIQNSFKYVADKEGRNPINYTRQSWWDYNVLPWSGWKDFPAWVAWYPFDPVTPLPCKYVPKEYSCKWSLHQFSADGNMQGDKYGAESKSIDLSKYNGTFEQFKLQFNITSEQPPEPPSPELSLEDWRTVMNREAIKAGWNLILK